MHGIIFSEMRKYVETRLGSGAWTGLLAGAGLGNKMYLPIQDYPDSDVFALVSAASVSTGLETSAILEDFGQFLAPSLLGLYRTLVQPQWKTLDVLEHTEHTIHSVVRARNPGAKPAELQAVRVSPDLVDLTYRSQRRLCPVAKGIIRGLAEHFGEQVEIEETACMHTGAEVCRMKVRVASAGSIEGVVAAQEVAPSVETIESKARSKPRKRKARTAALKKN